MVVVEPVGCVYWFPDESGGIVVCCDARTVLALRRFLFLRGFPVVRASVASFRKAAVR